MFAAMGPAAAGARATPQPVDGGPNLFLLAGEGVRIVCAPTGPAGEPELSYQDPERRRAFVGGEIRAQPTEFGRLVGVTLEAGPERPTRTLTLLLPDVTLLLGRAATPFAAPAILTTHHPAGGAEAAAGAAQTYRVVALRGTANRVMF